MQTYQFDFKLCISKLDINDQQINKLLRFPPHKKNKLLN